MIDFEKIKFKVNEKEITIGAVLESKGSTEITKTGSWRTSWPKINYEKCTSCGLCWVFCPEGCIKKRKEDGKFFIDLNYCKGCGICFNECPVKAITMMTEKK